MIQKWLLAMFSCIREINLMLWGLQFTNKKGQETGLGFGNHGWTSSGFCGHPFLWQFCWDEVLEHPFWARDATMDQRWVCIFSFCLNWSSLSERIIWRRCMRPYQRHIFLSRVAKKVGLICRIEQTELNHLLMRAAKRGPFFLHNFTTTLIQTKEKMDVGNQR